MSDIEKIVNEERKPSKWKSFISAISLTVLTMLGTWEAVAQMNANRDQILNQVEQTLKHKWPWEYKKLLEQRDALLKSYDNKWNIMENFISAQKKDFETAYKNNEYWIKNEIKTISIILENDFGVNVQWKSPVEIISIALKIISNEDSMTWLKEFSDNLSGNFDLAFMDAYGYIQAQNPNTWVKVWNTIMPNRELDGLVWVRTANAIIKILNDWNFTVDFSEPDLIDNFVPSRENTSNKVNIETTSNQWNMINNFDDRTKKDNKVNTPSVSQKNDESSMIDLDDIDDSVVPESQNDTKVSQDKQKDNSDNELSPANEDKIKDSDKQTPDKKENIQEQKDNKTDNEINLDDYSFEDPIADIVESMNWDSDILAQHLDKNNLVDISYQDIINTVDGFKHNNLKKTVMYYLLSNDIAHAQEIMWMSPDCDSRYPDFVAGNKLWKSELKKMKKLWESRRFDSPDEVLNNWNIPQKVKEVFSEVLEWKIKTDGKPYSIVSKDDYRVYMFSWDNHLLSRQSVLVWADRWDQKNNVKQWVQTTPGGAYRVGQKYENYLWKDFFVNYGSHYIILVPEDGQYDLTNQYSMWVHGDYKWDKSRKADLYSKESKDHRTTNGCINVDSDLFGEIYNHFELWALIYVTHDN